MTLLDPSGSGNTTTLMMIAGFETPSRGRIRVDGRDIAADPADRRNFGIVFQPCALFPHISVLDNVAFPLRMKGVGIRARQPQAAEMLEKVGLEALASRRPHRLSSGRQQRVALVRALIFAPDALLLDEPLGALDRKLREQLQSEHRRDGGGRNTADRLAFRRLPSPRYSLRRRISRRDQPAAWDM
jgi:putative spermidine/putrescine transport system ATP-binding protein